MSVCVRACVRARIITKDYIIYSGYIICTCVKLNSCTFSLNLVTLIFEEQTDLFRHYLTDVGLL